MYQGKADLVSTHLLDGDTGQYNLPYIRKILIGQPVVVVGFTARTAGFYTQKGNPLGFKQWEDLSKPGLRIANREKGSGARVLLDEQMRIYGIKPDALQGYEQEELSHLALAGKVRNGKADLGVGIEKVLYAYAFLSTKKSASPK
jgi:putative molybdopterin biosynthesis protein